MNQREETRSAELVGPDVSGIGMDRHAGFLEIARRRTQAAGLPNVTFVAFQEIDLTAIGTGQPAARGERGAAGWLTEVFRRQRLGMLLQLYGLSLFSRISNPPGYADPCQEGTTSSSCGLTPPCRSSSATLLPGIEPPARLR